MDIMTIHDTGTSISKNTERLARQNRQVFRMIDQMVYHVDQIVEEAKQDRWKNVERMSKVIAEESERSGYPGLCNAATMLHRAASSPVDERAARRGLIKLVGAIGRT
jgi:hypothetical protein